MMQQHRASFLIQRLRIGSLGRALIASLLLALALIAPIYAAPPLPSSFYGSVQLSGVDIPAGATVTAFVDGVQIAATTATQVDGVAVYTIDVLGDDPDTPAVEGGVDGKSITFQVDGVIAAQTAIWQAGTNTRLDLIAIRAPAPPVAAPQTLVTAEDTPLPILLTGSDANDDPLTFRVIEGPQHGSLNGDAPNLLYRPAADFHGADSFTFVANDGAADSQPATVAITVQSVNDAPTLDAIPNAVIDEGEQLTIPVAASDADGDALTWTTANLPAFAAFIDHGDGTGALIFAPGYDAAGSYFDLTIAVSDGALTADRSVSVTVLEAMPMPTAAFDVEFERNVAQLEEGAAIIAFSSAGSSTPASQAIDTSTFSLWRTAARQTQNQSFTVQLLGDQPHYIDRVRIQGSAGSTGVQNFEIYVSTTTADSAAFTTLAVAGVAPRESAIHEFSFAPLEARYVKFVAVNNWGSIDYIDVAHFEVLTRNRDGGIVSLREGAPAQIVSTSGHTGSGIPAQAIDEDGYTKWTASNQNQWITVDLGGQPYTIDRVRLQADFATQAVNAFEVRVYPTTLDDAAMVVFSGNGAQSTAMQEFSFAPVKARYVQLYVYSNYGSSVLSVNTFQAVTPDGRNVARGPGVGAFVVDVSSQNSNGAVNAIDFNPGNYWQTANGQNANQHLTVRLIGDDPQLVDRVQIRSTNANNAVRNFQILGSATGWTEADFQTLFEGTLPKDGVLHTFTFAPVAARYVKLRIVDNYGDSTVRVNDLRVFSPALGGETVPFYDRSIAPQGQIVAWAWDFGDGNGSTAQHPVHVYAAPGLYPVRLTVTSDQGFTATTTMNYRVLHRPTADYGYSPEPPLEGLGVNLFSTSTDADGSIVGWHWQFGFNTPDGTFSTALKTFPDNGDFPIVLTVTDSQLLQTTLTRAIHIENIPPQVEAGEDKVVVWRQPIAHVWLALSDKSSVDGGSLICTWDFGDGQTQQIDQCTMSKARVPYAYANPGVYTATLTVADKDGGVSSDTLQVTVLAQDSALVHYGAQTTAEGALIHAGLFDGFDFAPLAGRLVTTTVSGPGGSTTAATTVAADGLISVPVAAELGDTLWVTTTYAGESHYNGATVTDALPVLRQPPKGEVIFIMDETTSMGDKHDAVKRSVAALAQQLATSMDFRLGVVGYGQGVFSSPATIYSPLTNDIGAFNAALGQLAANGSTEVGFNAVVTAMSDAMGFRPDAGACAIIVTDDQAYVTPAVPETQADALAALHSRNAIFFGVINGSYGQSTLHYGPDPGSLAAETGGAVFDVHEFPFNPGKTLATIVSGCALGVVERIPADLAVAVESDVETIQPGKRLTYTISISNVGISTARAVMVTDTLPAYVTFVAASDGGAEADGIVAWPPFDLNRATAVTRTVIVQVQSPLPADVDSLINYVYVSDDGSRGTDPTPENNVAAVETGIIIGNEPPTAMDDEATTGEDTPVEIDLLGNDSDADSDALSLIALGAPVHGVAIINGPSVIYTPTLDFHGADVFTYTIGDGEFTATAAVTVTITPVNDAPIAMDDEVETDLDMSVVIAVLENDYDVDSSAITVVEISQPVTGTATLHADGTVTYAPAAGFRGADNFTYTISDGEISATATVIIHVVLPPVITCELYPIALSADTLTGATPGSALPDLFSGSGPGNFGWLTWTGNPNVPTLVNNLTPPGGSHTYVNPRNPADNLVSVGDWVQGSPGVANAKSVRDALDALLGQEIVVPVWGDAQNQGNQAEYQIADFARVRLTGYQLPGENRISAEWLGRAFCGETDLLRAGQDDLQEEATEIRSSHLLYLPNIGKAQVMRDIEETVIAAVATEAVVTEEAVTEESATEAVATEEIAQDLSVIYLPAIAR